jgi:hypothetical protein
MRKLKSQAILVCLLLPSMVHAQLEKMKSLDSSCKELVRIISLSDETQWRQFIVQNYAESLIKKYVKITQKEFSHTNTPNGTGSPSNTLESKVAMFKQLHDKIGNGKIKHLRIIDGQGEIILKGIDETFYVEVEFSRKIPYLITDLSITLGS